MSESLYQVTYLKHSLLDDAKRLTVELTQVELGTLLLDGTITLIGVTQMFENGNLKVRSDAGV